MTPGTKQQVAFLDGHVFAKDYVAVAGFLTKYKERKHTRIYILRGHEWAHFDLEFDLCALEGISSPRRRLYSLGTEGKLSIEGPGESFEEQIPDVHRYGELSSMSNIGGVLYACGIGGQVYRRGQKGWMHFDTGILQSASAVDSAHLQCIHGTREDDIYVVGSGGLVWHYNGQRWSKIDQFTTANLHWVRCVSDREVYACGSDGAVFRGYLQKWEKLNVRPSSKEGFWCLEYFGGKVYLAGNLKLYVVQENEVIRVDTGLSPAPDGNRLHANDGVLWSFGSYHLCFFDGKKWTYVKHPDNP